MKLTMVPLPDFVSRYWRSFSFTGLSVATLLFAVSVTPSLLPRNYVVQGILSGFALALGYGIGVLLVWTYRFCELPVPGDKLQRISKVVSSIAVLCITLTFLWRMTYWQNSIRDLMGMEDLETSYPYRTMLIAMLIGAILVGIARLLIVCTHALADRLKRYVPKRIAWTLGIIIVALATSFISNDLVAMSLLDAADRFFLQLDVAADEDLQVPPSLEDDESLIAWDTIGRQGKLFLAEGPTQESIETVTESTAMQPLRVYVGMRSRPTNEERAKLALEELKRVGGFDRSILVVATPTGTGWLDPSAVDSLEYLHRGDSAIVSMQYSYLPSWITILVDPRRSIESGSALFREIYGYWKTLPKEARPKLYLQGLSLGSLGSEVSADLFTIFEDPIDGAVWSGPPFPSKNWNQAVRARVEGSPVWLPEFRDQRLLRFTAQKNNLDNGVPWGPMRNVYIQYASDPMVWFSPDLAWTQPAWLGKQRGPDVSPYLRWYPIVTFLQVAFDLPMATTVPIGHGHNYSPSSYIDAWIAVTQPEDWSNERVEKLKQFFSEREAPKP